MEVWEGIQMEMWEGIICFLEILHVIFILQAKNAREFIMDKKNIHLIRLSYHPRDLF